MSPLARLQSRARLVARRSLVERARARDQRLGIWGEKDADPSSYRHVCNICGWHGDEFGLPRHCEGHRCPSCGSIARERFLHWCWTRRTAYRPGSVVLETSPRLGDRYRDAMRRISDYRCSDFDESLHKGDLVLDLQVMDLESSSLDTVLSAHVLEHVPDHTKALGELHRVLRPGGHLFLQVPLLQGRTAPPQEPEVHEDRTPVFWRFGFDLAATMRDRGFEVSVLVPNQWRSVIAKGDRAWAEQERREDFDTVSLMDGAVLGDLVGVASERVARRFGFEPPFMFATFEGVKPSGA